jgi:hypothetical protein
MRKPRPSTVCCPIRDRPQGFLWSPALPVPELAALVAALPHGRFALAPEDEPAASMPLQRMSPPDS